MIERLVLPERLPGPPQDSVGAPRGRSLQPAHQYRNGNLGKDEQMNMVRHHHPRTELVEASLALSDQNSFSHQIRDVGVLEPQRTDSAPVHGAVLSHEGMTSGGARRGIHSQRQCPPEAPSQEHVSVLRMKMRQSSAVVGHARGLAGETACPTKSSASIGQTISQKCFEDHLSCSQWRRYETISDCNIDRRRYSHSRPAFAAQVKCGGYARGH